jgi:threonine dehydrogenase-like Zn-dependent dehydrogenase
MLAASINYRDLETCRGTFRMKFKTPLVPLSDGVGEVVAVGADVTRAKVGERVCTCYWRRGRPARNLRGHDPRHGSERYPPGGGPDISLDSLNRTEGGAGAPRIGRSLRQDRAHDAELRVII